MRASIIIPSFNGAHKIPGLLDSLVTQTTQDYEVIVVIDGSTDRTTDILKPYHGKFRQLKVIEQNNQGRAAARNNGARSATSDLLIFYDDDMLPGPQSVERHLDFNSEQFGIVCGDAIEICGVHASEMQKYKAWLTAKWTNRYEKEVTRMKADDLFFTAANCSIAKKVFWQLNGFNESLTDAEDYELACRALEKHIPVFYDKSNKAVHNEQITCRRYVTRLREYSFAHKALRIRNPITPGKGRNVLKIKKLIYGAFAFPFWVRLIDAGFFRYLLPERARYTLYSVVIQALAYEYQNVRV